MAKAKKKTTSKKKTPAKKKKATRKSAPKKRNPKNSEPLTIAEMAERILDRAKKIKKENPNSSRRLSRYEDEIRQRLAKIKFELDTFPETEARLLTILTISRLEKLIEDILGKR